VLFTGIDIGSMSTKVVNLNLNDIHLFNAISPTGRNSHMDKIDACDIEGFEEETARHVSKRF
jgi:activator of 2-hydroxyglutaryl-CoA dehydratase